MKKTNKENPLSFFRKANETRQKNVRASIKKAQDGIEMNDDLINKSGSTGGYKKTPEKWWLSDTTKMLTENANNVRIANMDALNKTRPTQLSSLSSLPSLPHMANIEDNGRAQAINKAYRDSLTYPGPSSIPKTVKGVVGGQNMEFTPEQLKAMGIYKKGGAVKRKK